jgi:hypothetical protein
MVHIQRCTCGPLVFFQVKSENFTKWPILDQKTRVTLRTHRTNFIVFFLPFFYFLRSSTSCRLKIHQICKGFPTFSNGWTGVGVLTENRPYRNWAIHFVGIEIPIVKCIVKGKGLSFDRYLLVNYFFWKFLRFFCVSHVHFYFKSSLA